MSDLRRSAMLNSLPHMPTISPYAQDDNDNDEDEGNEEEEENDSLGALPSMGPPPRRPHPKPRSLPNPQYAPLSAEGYFAQAAEVAVPASGLAFRVYYTPPALAPGASQKEGTVLVCHHGAGHSSLSFALFAKEVKDRTKGECGVLALDARRHGKTKPLDDAKDDSDLAIDTLVSDAYNLLVTIFPDPANAPTFVLVGHSLGGSVLVRASSRLLDAKYRLTGVAVLDIVEGFTIDALPHMHTLLDSRPEGFETLEEAIEWHVANHTIRNPLSARISVPSLIIPSTSNTGLKYIWRTPLRSTAPYWESWFRGLSSSFLSVRSARLLVLAGTERLDKELMIGQMQGKFQLQVVPDTGHMIHEDNPTRLAEIIVEFWRRNEKVVIGVKKVGER
ncbi:hypothetical protein ACEPAG_7166 [Sanghuangporus baumii]